MTEVVAGGALLATTIGVEDADGIELAELKTCAIDGLVGAADAAQAHTALAEAATARPVTAPQALRTLVAAAVLIATVKP